MICPKCSRKYAPWFSECTDCKIPLVAVSKETDSQSDKPIKFEKSAPDGKLSKGGAIAIAIAGLGTMYAGIFAFKVKMTETLTSRYGGGGVLLTGLAAQHYGIFVIIVGLTWLIYGTRGFYQARKQELSSTDILMAIFTSLIVGFFSLAYTIIINE